MSEPEWSLPLNRTELIARCEALDGELMALSQDDGKVERALMSAQERIASLEAERDEALAGDEESSREMAHYREGWIKADKRIRELEARNEALRVALRGTPCPKKIQADYSKVGAYFASWCVNAGQCDCGVDAALADEKEIG